LANLLKHTKDDNEMLLIHKGYGHAICDLLELDNSNILLKDVESDELQTEQPLQNEEVREVEVLILKKFYLRDMHLLLHVVFYRK